ncbi:MAG: bifunctional diaminohydroxyphosphoribosylaminopyrimidine deaminase/5-amino-6-(5-phosphoribosylamino)uracil reductase RibD [Candidatus Dormibacteria bacterium]
MARALKLASGARYRTSPNPTVGAVLTRDGEVVGEGHHLGPGSAHAEVVALQRAGELARGATLWVTLEPCCHRGRTGPCTERLLAAGVAEVRIATLDPNPRVNGHGAELLQAAGVEVRVGEQEQRAKELIREFACWVTQGRPLVTLKFAMSLDGKVATSGGQSQWITSEPARERAHLLRSQHDAVLVGSGTVLADDPRLTARDGSRELRQPLRAVVDTRLRTPPGARLLQASGGPVLVATVAGADPARSGALTRAGAEVVELPAGSGGVDIAELLRQLARREVTSLLVEGGPTLLGSFLEQRLGDRIAAFLAPIVLGGVAAPGPFAGAGVASLGEGWRATGLRAEPVGRDLLLTAEV